MVSALTGPRLSTGLPSTLKMRPRVAWPTGTEMDAPVPTAVMPRCRPSVVSIATQRTQLLPRCFSTSRISRFLALARQFDGVVDFGQFAIAEFAVHDAALDLHNFAVCLSH